MLAPNVAPPIIPSLLFRNNYAPMVHTPASKQWPQWKNDIRKRRNIRSRKNKICVLRSRLQRRLKSNGPLESQHNRKPFFFSSSPNICPMLLFLTHPFCPFPLFHSSTSPSRLMASLSCSILTHISTARFRPRYLFSLLSAHLIC